MLHQDPQSMLARYIAATVGGAGGVAGGKPPTKRSGFEGPPIPVPPPRKPFPNPQLDPISQAYEWQEAEQRKQADANAALAQKQLEEDMRLRGALSRQPLAQMPQYHAPKYEPPNPYTLLGLALAGLLFKGAAPAMSGGIIGQKQKADEDYQRNVQAEQAKFDAERQRVAEENAASTARLGRLDTAVSTDQRDLEFQEKHKLEIHKAFALERFKAQNLNATIKRWADQHDEAEKRTAGLVQAAAIRENAAMVRAGMAHDDRVAALRVRMKLAEAQMQIAKARLKITQVEQNQRAKYRGELNNLERKRADLITEYKKAIDTINNPVAKPGDKAAAKTMLANIQEKYKALDAEFTALNIDTSGVDQEFMDLGTTIDNYTTQLDQGTAAAAPPGGTQIFVQGGTVQTGATNPPNPTPLNPSGQTTAPPPASMPKGKHTITSVLRNPKTGEYIYEYDNSGWYRSDGSPAK